MHLIIGILGLAATLYATRHNMPTGFTGFFHPAALILLLCAPPAILLVGHTFRSVWEGLKILVEALRSDARRARAAILVDLYRLGRALRQGRAAEAQSVLSASSDPLLREVGALLLQPGGGGEVRETMATLGYARLARVRAGEEIFRSLGRTTPAVGLMGTILGLVNMLMNLKNFEQLGPAMAVAQLATLYGLLLAYGLWMPLAKRIEGYGRDQEVAARLVERGLISIAEGRSLYDLRLLAGEDGGVPAGAAAGENAA
jgi:chemotaxis protein MotA